MNIQNITEHKAEPISTPTDTVHYVFAYRIENRHWWHTAEGWPVEQPLEQQLQNVFGSRDEIIAEVRVFKIRLPIIAYRLYYLNPKNKQ